MLRNLIFRTMEVLMVACLAAMVTMVFTNAALRKLSDYGLTLFGGGITVSEELSRILFVWLTFVGAVVVAVQWGHLGVETLVEKLRGRARIAAMFTSDILVLVCCAVLFIGTWRQAPIHADNIAPVTGMPMIWVYGAGFVTSIFAVRMDLSGATYLVPNAPGLGIEVDEVALSRAEPFRFYEMPHIRRRDGSITNW
jgi:TRAP-type C4-dicarboxylate transport system permease small subunit